jgi:starvation-inducible DNA-binding protein
MKQTGKNPIDSDLSSLLCDYQILYQKLRGYHWTVAGPLFFELHAKFEELYRDAAEKVDAIAERIAARGSRPPVTLKEYVENARLKEDAGRTAALDMVRNLAGDFEALNGVVRPLSARAEEAGDIATMNLLDAFADGQEKTIWMLKAFLSA